MKKKGVIGLSRVKTRMCIAVFSLLALLMLIPAQPAQAAGPRSVKVGTTISVKKKNAAYSSSDKSIAYVSRDGTVTGKKKGTAVISIKRSGKKTVRQTVNVVANGKKKGIYVCTDEIVLSEPQVTNTAVTPAPAETPQTAGQEVTQTAGQEALPVTYDWTVSAELTNNSAAAAKKVELTGTIGETSVTLNFGKMKAGQKKTVTQNGNSATEVRFEPSEIRVYSGDMVSACSYQTQKRSYKWATKDTKAPVISGFVGKNSYNKDWQGKKIPYRIVYKSQKKTFDYLKYVTATDDRDSDKKIELKVDTSKVNFNKTGTYRITYTATDTSGNRSRATAYIGVRTGDTELDAYTADILSDITRPSWSDTQKARAIYNFIKRHMRYSGYSNYRSRSSWEREAQAGIENGHGDCYTYYCMSRALLTQAGIPNIEVTRVRGHGHHWWNMAYVQGDFYHYDACPRATGGRFCLVNDAQLKRYSAGRGRNSHIWDYKHKPKSGTKTLSSI